VGFALEDAEKASDGEEGSEEPNNADAEAAWEEEAQDTEAEDPDSGLAQTEETSEAPVWTDVTRLRK